MIKQKLTKSTPTVSKVTFIVRGSLTSSLSNLCCIFEHFKSCVQIINLIIATSVAMSDELAECLVMAHLISLYMWWKLSPVLILAWKRWHNQSAFLGMYHTVRQNQTAMTSWVRGWFQMSLGLGYSCDIIMFELSISLLVERIEIH